MFDIITIFYIYLFLITNNQCKTISSLSSPKYWLEHPNLPEENRREYFYFYLKQQNNEILNEYLRNSADPSDPLYNKTPWLTLEQINTIVRPDPISIKVFYKILHQTFPFQFLSHSVYIIIFGVME